MPRTHEEFLQQRAARRGTGNGQRVHVPLWEELVRSGESAYHAAMRYGRQSLDGPAGWSFDRFGMTRTRLPDGRIVCIAGEHEDGYDPDFYIYNDVIVIAPDGEIAIYAYAPDVFPPADFHTATLVGDAIFIVGSLGYQNTRDGGATPVWRLDLDSMRIHPVGGTGSGPGRIYEHRAELAPDGRSIRVAAGKVIARDPAGKERHTRNQMTFAFDASTLRWSRAEGTVPTMAPSLLDLPPGWKAPKNDRKAQHLRDSIARAVAPDHPLFCGDFWPIAEQEGWPMRVVLQMLDPVRCAVCDSPSYTGREQPPSLAVQFYADAARALAAIENASDDVS